MNILRIAVFKLGVPLRVRVEKDYTVIYIKIFTFFIAIFALIKIEFVSIDIGFLGQL